MSRQGVLRDLIGQKFGRLAVEDYAGEPPDDQTKIKYVCLCDCGTVTEVFAIKLKYGQTKSCGCLRDEVVKTHGGLRTRHPSEYMTWYSKRRFPNNMADEWCHSFATFLRDVGPKPPGAVLQKIDPGYIYCPGNCRWVVPEEED